MTTADILRQRAAEYLAWGLPPVPIFKGKPTTPWQVYRHRLPTTQEIEQWRWEAADGLGLVLGHPNPHGKYWWVWDVETPHRGQVELWLDENYPGWREGLIAQSQRNGLHIYCLSQQPVRTQKHPFGDIKAVGSLIFAPPTRRFKPDATSDYVWLAFNPEEALQLEPSDLPWSDAPAENGHQQEPSLAETLKTTIPVGNRHNTMVRVAGWLRGVGQLEPDEILTVLRQMNRRCEEPLPDQELVEIAKSTSKWPADPTLVVVNGKKDEFISPTIERGVGETNSTPDSWLPVPISELGTDTTTTEWLWEGFLARGHVTDFVGFWKSGKSTLLAALLQRMEHGGELAGRAVRPGKALVVTEEPKAKWVERREALDLGDHVHVISRPFPKRPNHAEWHAFTSHITRLVAEHGYDLVAFDSLPNLWSVVDENNAAEVISALLPLQAIASAGCAVLFLRHPRKSDGGQATAGRGSGAIAGFVDIIVEMRRYDPEQQQDTRRVLSVYSRYEPFEVVVRWNGGGEYETLGSPAAYSAEAQRERLLEALVELGNGATTADLARVVDLPHATVSRRLDELAATGRVTRTGTGKKGDPYRWSLANGGDDPDGDDFVSPTNTPTVGEMKSDEKHHIPHHEAQNGEHGSVDFFSPTNTPIVGETKTDEKHHTWLPEAKNGGHTPDGDVFFSPTIAPIVGETKTDGKPENLHQNCKKALHTPVDHTSGTSDEPENPHQNCKKALHTCVVCGQAILQVSGQATLYCSTACRVKAYRQRRSSADTPGRIEPEPLAVEWTTLTLTPFMSVNVNEPRHRQSAPGRVTPGSLATETNGHPPDPGTCLDCHQPITAEGFQYRCPACLKARYDRLGREYPEKLVRWLEAHTVQKGGHRDGKLEAR